ncbi:hypothetical protein B0H16DRAFT_1842906, partial [Mycena metata]
GHARSEEKIGEGGGHWDSGPRVDVYAQLPAIPQYRTQHHQPPILQRRAASCSSSTTYSAAEPAADSSSTGIQKGATTHECTTTSFRTARPARRRHILLVVQVRGGMHTCSADATSKTDWAARLAPNRRCFRQQPTSTHPSASCLNGAHALPHRHPKVPMTCTRQCGAPNRCVLLHSSCIARVRTPPKSEYARHHPGTAASSQFVR